MRTMIVGAGAVGVYYWAKLAAAGQPVVFVAREENLAALRAGGVRVDDSDGTLAVERVEAVVEPAQALWSSQRARLYQRPALSDRWSTPFSVRSIVPFALSLPKGARACRGVDARPRAPVTCSAP